MIARTGEITKHIYKGLLLLNYIGGSMLKIGDKVSCNGGHSFDPSIGIIKSHKSGLYSVQIQEGKDELHKGKTWNYDKSSLTLLKSAKKAKKVKKAKEVTKQTIPFKVGDRVESKQINLEYTGTITSITDTLVTVKRDDGHYKWFCEVVGKQVATAYGMWDKKSFLTKILDKKAVQPSAFKVGDTVKVTTHNPKHGWGAVSRYEIGTVIRVKSPEEYNVKFPKQSDWNAHISDIELVKPAELIKVDTLQVNHSLLLKGTKQEHKVLAIKNGVVALSDFGEFVTLYTEDELNERYEAIPVLTREQIAQKFEVPCFRLAE
jgi:hypothetical protein